MRSASCWAWRRRASFPGIIFYLTYWYPARERARAYAWFLAAIPVCGVIGGPISGALLGLDGRLGLQGWQWLFLLEGIPSIAGRYRRALVAAEPSAGRALASGGGAGVARGAAGGGGRRSGRATTARAFAGRCAIRWCGGSA